MSNLDFINKARSMLTADYHARHTAEYNRWLLGHKNSWMQPHVIVPFPPFVISGALAPFKPTSSAPSEEEVVAKALELYNNAHPPIVNNKLVESETKPDAEKQHLEVNEDTLAVEPEVIEPEVVESAAVEPEVIESAAVESAAVEPEVIEPEVIEPEVHQYVDDIHKIYEMPAPGSNEFNSADPTFVSIENALSVIPQPTDELAKISGSGKIMPKVFETIKNITDKLTKKG